MYCGDSDSDSEPQNYTKEKQDDVIPKTKKKTKEPTEISKQKALQQRIAPEKSVSMIIESKFMRELLTFIKNFNEQININFHSKGLKILFMDVAKVSVIVCDIFSSGMDYWSWKIDKKETREFTHGLKITDLLKALQLGHKRCKYIRFLIAPDSTRLKIEFYPVDPSGEKPLLTHKPQLEYEIPLLLIEEDALAIPTDPPPISLLLRSEDFVQIMRDWKAHTDEICFSFEYETKKRRINPKKKVSEIDDIKKSLYGATTKKMELIDADPNGDNDDAEIELKEKYMIISYSDKTSNTKGAIRFELNYEGDDDDEEDIEQNNHLFEDRMPAPWDVYTLEMSKDAPKDSENFEDEPMYEGETELLKSLPSYTGDIHEDLGYVFMTKTRKFIEADNDQANKKPKKPNGSLKIKSKVQKNKATIVSCSSKTSPLPPTSFPAKILHYASLGRSLSDKITLDFYDDCPIHINYEIGVLASLKCCIAPKLHISE